MADDKTPPTGTPAVPPPRPLPTVATVQSTVEVLVGQVKGLRRDVDELIQLIRNPPPEVIRFSVPPSITTTPVPESRPSIAAKAAQSTSKLGKVLMIGTGVLTVAGQLVALWKPEYTGPIIQALRLLASLGGGDP